MTSPLVKKTKAQRQDVNQNSLDDGLSSGHIQKSNSKGSFFPVLPL